MSVAAIPSQQPGTGPAAAKLLAQFAESEALTIFLAEQSGIQGLHSCLSAAISDARFAFGRGTGPGSSVPKALWLGSLGYLAAVEMIGKYLGLGKPGQQLRWIKAEDAQFRSAVRDFGDSTGAETADALWALRCTLVHQFTMPGADHRKPLRRQPTTGNYRYRLTEEGGPLYVSAADADDNVPTINVWELKRFVEAMVARARELHEKREVGLRLSGKDLLACGTFYVGG